MKVTFLPRQHCTEMWPCSGQPHFPWPLSVSSVPKVMASHSWRGSEGSSRITTLVKE